MSFEIERKWILTRLPRNLSIEDATIIEQSYLSVNEFGETRVRKITKPDGKVRYSVDFKSPTSLKRSEINSKINEDEYNLITKELLEVYEPITKKYFRCPYGRNHTIEVSLVDEGTNDSFVYAEVEFQSEEDASEFLFPWEGILDKEVTGNPEYSMCNYWNKTRVNKGQ